MISEYEIIRDLSIPVYFTVEEIKEYVISHKSDEGIKYLKDFPNEGIFYLPNTIMEKYGGISYYFEFKNSVMGYALQNTGDKKELSLLKYAENMQEFISKAIRYNGIIK